MKESIGLLCLNISFILYLVVYVPQLIHNIRSKHLHELSLLMHYALFIAYGLDLIYGCLMNFQWQYKMVSIVGFSLFIVQHIQLLIHQYPQKKQRFIKHSLCFLFFLFSLFFAFNTLNAHHTMLISLFGACSRILFLSALIPQFFKNKYHRSSKSLSIYFLYLNILLTTIDLIAAWCLNWGWPNKLGGPISLFINSILLYQRNQLQRTEDYAYRNI